MKMPSFLQRLDSANLRLRVLSALIMMPIVLFAVYWGGIVFDIVTIGTMAVGLYEWLRLVAPDMRAQMVGIACTLMVSSLIAGALVSISCGAAAGFVLTIVLFALVKREHAAQAGWIAFGLPYVGGGGLALLALRTAPLGCAGLAFYLLAVVWGTDIGAYMAGRLIGGPRLAPVLSPSKTWAGLFGGMALAVILGYFAAEIGGAGHPAVALALSPVLALAAQAGDLFESYFKRRANVKESGDLIPGHGGVLDRIDGLVFAGIFASVFQAVVGQAIHWW